MTSDTPQPREKATKRLWLKLGRSVNLNLCNFVQGLVFSQFGVALLDLVEIYESDVHTMSHVITVSCVGCLLGSLVGGKMFDKYNTQVMTMAGLGITAVAVPLIPISGYLLLALLVAFVVGLFLGAIDTGVHIWVIRLWPKKSGSALQLFHLSYGVGSLVAPLITEPFMSTPAEDSNMYYDNETAIFSTQKPPPHPTTAVIAPTTSTDAALTSVRVIETMQNVTNTGPLTPSQVPYAFGITGGLVFLLFVSVLVLYMVDRSDFKISKTEEEQLSSGQETVKDVRFRRVFLGLVAVYLFIYAALECTYAMMITSYAVKCDLHLSKSAASRLTAVFYLSWVASRAVASVVAIRTTPFHLLLASHVMLVVAATILLIWARVYEPVLWVSSALIGIGQGPIYAAVVSWAVSYIAMNNVMMSSSIIAGGLGGLVPSLLVGQLLESAPEAFVYVCFGAVVISTAVFFVMFWFSRGRPVLGLAKETVHANAENVGNYVLLEKLDNCMFSKEIPKMENVPSDSFTK